MRVRLLRSVIHKGVEHPTGSRIEVSDGLGASLIAGGVAEQVRILQPLTRPAGRAPTHRKDALPR